MIVPRAPQAGDPDALYFAASRGDLGAFRKALGQLPDLEEARQPLLDALQLMESRGMSHHHKARKVTLMLAEGCDATGRSYEAVNWRSRAEAIRLRSTSVATPSPATSTTSRPARPGAVD